LIFSPGITLERAFCYFSFSFVSGFWGASPPNPLTKGQPPLGTPYMGLQLEKAVYAPGYCVKLVKGKALRKHSLHEKTAASVLFEAVHQW